MNVRRWLPIGVALLFPAVHTVLAQTVTCASEDGEKHYCPADTRHGARMVKQTSEAPCAERISWGYDEEGIWVDKGCAGEFALGSEEKGDEEAAPGGQAITCTSEGGGRKYCPVETQGNVQLVKQRSDAPCAHGTGWGFDTHGIWVNKGCSADFVVGVPEHPSVEAAEKKANQRVSCSSDDGRKNYCDVDTRGAKVQLARQVGPTPCNEGSTWGYDKQGIWVDRGCRGEFVVVKIAGPGQPQSCAEAAGKKKAKELVDRCLQVSPATHPPCNAQNSCELMEDEVRRSCKLLGAGAPAFCAEYK
jgi:hypothetical protein